MPSQRTLICNPDAPRFSRAARRLKHLLALSSVVLVCGCDTTIKCDKGIATDTIPTMVRNDAALLEKIQKQIPFGSRTKLPPDTEAHRVSQVDLQAKKKELEKTVKSLEADLDREITKCINSNITVAKYDTTKDACKAGKFLRNYGTYQHHLPPELNDFSKYYDSAIAPLRDRRRDLQGSRTLMALVSEINDAVDACRTLKGKEFLDEHQIINELCEGVKNQDLNNWAEFFIVDDAYPPLFEYHKTTIAPIQASLDEARKSLESTQAKAEEEGALFQKLVSEDWQSKLAAAKISMRDIIPLDKDESTGAVTCKSTIDVNVENWGLTAILVNYKIEKNSEGKAVVSIEK